ncbi:MAG: ROK family protein [Planctomycetota bacterium]|jgi:allose kinase|nr:ROK family protein [Planctomycetota bacterium]
METCIFTMEITSGSVRAAFVSPDRQISDLTVLNLDNFSGDPSEQPEKLLALLTAKARTAPARLTSAILLMGCDIDRRGTRVTNHPTAEWLIDFPLAKSLSDALGVPVAMQRRSLAFLSLDMEMLDLPRDCLAIGCYVGTHIENAVWYRGGPIAGRNGTAGNIAHLAVHGREDACFCGKNGCVDIYGAGLRLRQIHTMIFPDTELEEIFLRLGDHPILRDYLSMMAYPIAMETNLLDPDFIIIGGWIPAMPGFPFKQLEEEIARFCYLPGDGAGPIILPSAVEPAKALAWIGRSAFAPA